MTSSFSQRPLSTTRVAKSGLIKVALFFSILLTISGCAKNPDMWSPSTWFSNTSGNRSSDHSTQSAPEVDSTKNITPGFGKGPLAPPQAAPTIPVQMAQVPIPPQGPNAKVKVAILLPLTGTNADLGQSLLNAAQMAVFDTAPGNFELMPRDTAAKGGAEAAARDALASGAQLLIGPLFATDIPPVKAIAIPSGAAMLTLSTDSTQQDRGVYIMGFTPSAQVERIVAFAAQHGAHRFAALVSGTAYGTLVAQDFEAAVARAGGSLVALETYNSTQHDSAAHIHTLSLIKHQIDAILLPEAGAELSTITTQLSNAGFDSHVMHVLGTGLWDDPALGTTQPFLIGGWYAAPDSLLRHNFTEAYKKTYGQDPVRLATLAYDATALSAALAKRGTRLFDEGALTNPNGFAGLDGIFRLRVGGGVERGLAVNEVTAEGPHVVNPAPVTFAGANDH